MKSNLKKIEEEYEDLERRRNECNLERVRRRKEIVCREQQQRERKQTLDEEKNRREEKKRQLLVLCCDSSCLLLAGEEREGGDNRTGEYVINVLAEFTGIKENMRIEEMLDECEAVKLKKKYLQQKKRDEERVRERLRQEKDELIHQLGVYRGCVDEQILHRLNEEQQEKDQLHSIQSLILQDLERCEVG